MGSVLPKVEVSQFRRDLMIGTALSSSPLLGVDHGVKKVNQCFGTSTLTLFAPSLFVSVVSIGVGTFLLQHDG